jgi:PBP1b-binding outer membrane lipoprotein LpoB
METSKKRLLALAIIPVAALLLSGCGKQATPTGSSTVPTVSQNTPQSEPQVVADTAVKTDATATKPQIDPLPADDKQAIDTELTNIDKDIKTTDNLNNSTDLSNANLGL